MIVDVEDDEDNSSVLAVAPPQPGAATNRSGGGVSMVRPSAVPEIIDLTDSPHPSRLFFVCSLG